MCACVYGIVWGGGGGGGGGESFTCVIIYFVRVRVCGWLAALRWSRVENDGDRGKKINKLKKIKSRDRKS